MHATMLLSYINPDAIKPHDPIKAAADKIWEKEGKDFKTWERERRTRELIVSGRHYYELQGYFLLRDYSPRPPYFQARNCADDDLFLDKIGNSQLPWRKQFGYPETDFEAIVKDSVAHFLWRKTRPQPHNLKSKLYPHFVRGYASLLYALLPKEFFFKIGVLVETQKQCPEGTSFQTYCDTLCSLTSDKEKYCLVTQPDLATYLSDVPGRSGSVKLTDWDEIALSEITKLVKEFDSSSTILEVNEYTKWLMTLLREENNGQRKEIVAKAMQMADFGDILKCVHSSSCGCRYVHESVKEFTIFLGSLFDRLKSMIKGMVRVAPKILFSNSDRHESSPVIAEIVEVAEIRRFALGNRFISRTHLLWAFYTLGYSLPSAIRDVIDVNSADKDVPPYHIYTAAVMVAESLGEYTVRLEHFIFAVLCSENEYFKGKQGVEIRQDFNVFQQALESSSDSSGVSNDSNLSKAMETKSRILFRSSLDLNDHQ